LRLRSGEANFCAEFTLTQAEAFRANDFRTWCLHPDDPATLENVAFLIISL